MGGWISIKTVEVKGKIKCEQKFKNMSFANEEQQKMIIDIFSKSSIKAKFINPSTIELYMKAYNIAIKDKYTNFQWKFMNYKPNLPEIEKFLPKEVAETVIDYIETDKAKTISP